MPPVTDLRPQTRDIKYRPGSAYTMVLTGPAGWLTTYSFTATLAETDLVVTEAGDDLQIDIPADLTEDHPVSGGAIPFVMTQTGGNDVLVGSWKPSMTGTTAPPVIELDVTLAGPEIDVTLVVGPAGVGGSSSADLITTDDSGWTELSGANVQAALDSADAAIAGAHYRHVQSLAATVWTVVHNLGFRPGGIYVENSAHDEVRPRISHVDTNTLTLSFFANGLPVAEAGEADIS